MTIGSAHLTCACIAGTASEEKLHPFECIRRHSSELPGAAEKVRAFTARWHTDGWLATENVPSVDPHELVRAARSVRRKRALARGFELPFLRASRF